MQQRIFLCNASLSIGALCFLTFFQISSDASCLNEPKYYFADNGLYRHIKTLEKKPTDAITQFTTFRYCNPENQKQLDLPLAAN